MTVLVDGYAPDGSPVPLYRRLPPRTGDAELIHQVLPEGADVRDLGCGTGRLAELAAATGLRVDAPLTDNGKIVLLRPA